MIAEHLLLRPAEAVLKVAVGRAGDRSVGLCSLEHLRLELEAETLLRFVFQTLLLYAHGFGPRQLPMPFYPQ